MFLYAYTRPNVMTGHRFTDDAAITLAWNKPHAYKKFKRLYRCSMKDIRKISILRLIGKTGVEVLTDY